MRTIVISAEELARISGSVRTTSGVFLADPESPLLLNTEREAIAAVGSPLIMLRDTERPMKRIVLPLAACKNEADCQENELLASRGYEDS
jgi:hypothetical protein